MMAIGRLYQIPIQPCLFCAQTPAMPHANRLAPPCQAPLSAPPVILCFALFGATDRSVFRNKSSVPQETEAGFNTLILKENMKLNGRYRPQKFLSSVISSVPCRKTERMARDCLIRLTRLAARPTQVAILSLPVSRSPRCV